MILSNQEVEMPTQIVDLSALYWRNWHASDGDEISSARRKTLGFIRSLYGNGEVIVAMDTPPYWRKDVLPDYKSNRAERSEAAIEELKRCEKEILADGWKSARAKGYEADDVIYTLVQQHNDAIVYGTDKDLLQCCDIIEPWSGKKKTPEETLGVKREQVVDYLTLVGDQSDNVPGVKGVGPKTAQAMLDKFGNLRGIFDALHIHINNPDSKQFKPKTADALTSAMDWIDDTKGVITLQDCSDDLVIKQNGTVNEDLIEQDVEDHVNIEPEQPTTTAITVSHDKIGFRQSLEPIGINECWRVSEAFYQSRLYSKFPTPQAIMVTIMRGRALGLDATTALDGIHVIQGKPTMAASLMVGLVLASPKCEFLYCVDTNENVATWVGKRAGMPEQIERRFNMGDAKKLGLTTRDQWQKQPATMLKWRAAAMIIRELFPDVINGLYAAEEMI